MIAYESSQLQEIVNTWSHGYYGYASQYLYCGNCVLAGLN